MESKPQEQEGLKKEDDDFDPSLLLLKGFEQLNINPKDPGFTQERAI